jgi:DNA-binding IclR family transcriptional regulator
MAQRQGGGIEGAALRAAIIAAGPEPPDLLATVERALNALEVIAAAPGPMPAKAVAQRLEISLGTSYRILHTLEHAGYVVRLGHGCFGLGSKISRLSRLFHEHLAVADVVPPVLERLAAEAAEDAYLAVFRGGEVAVADVVEGSRALHVEGVDVGFSRLAHTTAIGKVLLAACPDDTLDDYLEASRLAAYTRRTLVDRREIKRHLRVVRDRGLGHDLEELADGCCCVAAPVRGPGGAVVGSVGLSTTTERWRADQEWLTRLCIAAAAQASRALVPEAHLPGRS